MPTKETLIAFRQGLKALDNAQDYLALREIITKMVALVTPQDEAMAKDAIARVLRKKQALELQSVQGYPQAIQQLDQKYKDLYVALKNVRGQQPMQAQPQMAPQPQQQPQPQQAANPLSKLNGLSAPLMLFDWIKTKKSSLMMGTALLTTVGGAYYFYNKLTKDDKKSKKKDSETDTSFDRTLKSIQKYHLFSKMTRNPDFAEEYIMGTSKSKKKKVTKKSGPDKLSEWDYEERALMKNMDSTFNALSTRPKLKVELPQLPEPKEIGTDIVKGLTGDTFEPQEKPKKKKRRGRKPKPEPISEEPKVESPSTPSPSVEDQPAPKKRRGRPKKSVDTSSETKPKRQTRAKTKAAKTTSPGRLIPIVKRTKRISKIKA